jgi:hypothetical protein
LDKNIVFLFFTFWLLFHADLDAQRINHIDPPSWYKGMEQKDLELLVYGKNISALKPDIN